MVTRAQFLRRAGGVAAALGAAGVAGWAGWWWWSEDELPGDAGGGGVPRRYRRERVIVVGAGIAGIAAARFLHDKGFDVTVLEARDRLGGRIFSDRSLGVPVDLGASYVEGSERIHPITRLARRFGVRLRNGESGDIWMYRDGRELSDSVLERAEEDFEWATERIAELSEEADDDKPVSWAIDKLDLGDGDVDASVRWGIHNEIEQNYAADADELSLWALDSDEGFDGDDHVVPGGYDQIPRKLAKGLDIRQEAPVRAIRHGQHGVEVETDSARFKADRAIVTVPLGVLKARDIEFHPGLDARKLTAIDRLGMGLVDKAVLRFERRFWPADIEYAGVIGPAGATFAELWLLHKVVDEPVIMAVTSGKSARMWEELGDAEALRVVMDAVRGAYGDDVPEPTANVMQRWGKERYTRGSYSHLPVGVDFDEYRALARPVGKHLLFAGEATNALMPATVHGAYLSGIREAKRLMRLAAVRD